MAEKSGDISRGARFTVDLAVECYPSISSGETLIESSSKEPSFEGEVTNISSGGVCIVTTHLLKVKEILKVSFPIQSSISTYISTPRTLVEVRWIKPTEKNKLMAGLRFLL